MLKWNVIISDMNSNQIETYNIFDHGSFYLEINRICKKRISKDEFIGEVKSALMYYFWSKAEWEIIVSPWCGNREKNEKKIDVYWQVMNNFEQFIEYLIREKGLPFEGCVLI